ncbi:dehydrogenase [Shinella sedimenti]|uniref:Dehydrogenase n=1 Tax=Shinella sedimenti TaxID=2919913 RepID=A0ABT0CH68_9HYPH|nr:dehydrogenase [Shinella sedimenti]MCJ8147961.1 dehydrogenase [Shinella sedimenti]
MQPLYEPVTDAATLDAADDDPVDAALAWHGGDVRATIETLLADCAHLQRQFDLMRAAMGRGFTRGWEPSVRRDQT